MCGFCLCFPWVKIQLILHLLAPGSEVNWVKLRTMRPGLGLLIDVRVSLLIPRQVLTSESTKNVKCFVFRVQLWEGGFSDFLA